MGSTRLPGKVLKKIGRRTLLEHIFFRLSFLKGPVEIIVATTVQKKDDAIEALCCEHQVKCFRGSEENVLERYVLCARQNQYAHVIRLTADNPFVDIEEIDRLIELHLKTGADYSNSFKCLPIGIGAEIFTMEALERCYLLGKEPQHIEHVNEYILENTHDFFVQELAVAPQKNRPEIRLTVDTQEDYEKACYIVQMSGQDYIDTEEAIELCLQYA